MRKFYELTDAGRGRLRAFQQQWAPFSATVLQLVGKDDSHD